MLVWHILLKNRKGFEPKNLACEREIPRSKGATRCFIALRARVGDRRVGSVEDGEVEAPYAGEGAVDRLGDAAALLGRSVEVVAALERSGRCAGGEVLVVELGAEEGHELTGDDVQVVIVASAEDPVCGDEVAGEARAVVEGVPECSLDAGGDPVVVM